MEVGKLIFWGEFTMSKTLKGLVLFSTCNLVCMSIGAILSIVLQLPARFGGLLSGNNVLQDFLYMNGTAVSPDLWFLLGQFVLIGCALRRGRVGMVGVIGLTLVGAVTTLGQLGEPITVRAFSPATFDGAQTSLVAVNIASSLLMFVFGILEWRSCKQANWATSVHPEMQTSDARRGST
jgi:hypothetical protein